jgi:hypothetical protein
MLAFVEKAIDSALKPLAYLTILLNLVSCCSLNTPCALRLGCFCQNNFTLLVNKITFLTDLATFRELSWVNVGVFSIYFAEIVVKLSEKKLFLSVK